MTSLALCRAARKNTRLQLIKQDGADRNRTSEAKGNVEEEEEEEGGGGGGGGGKKKRSRATDAKSRRAASADQ